MTRKAQHGFSVVLVLGIILLVAALGLVIWMANSKSGKSGAVNEGTNTGAQIAVPPTKTALSKAPQDLQAVVFNYTKATYPKCVKDTAIVDAAGKATDQDITYVATNNTTASAITSVGCDGGYKVLFAKVEGKWSQVESVQLAFSCEKLKAAHAPTRLLQTAFQGSPAPTNCTGTNTQVIEKYNN